MIDSTRNFFASEEQGELSSEKQGTRYQAEVGVTWTSLPHSLPHTVNYFTRS